MNTQLIHKLFDVATFDESRVRSYVNEDGSQTEIYQPYIPLTWCGEPTRFSITSEQINKFAELIVRECIGCCDQVISDPVPKSVDTWLNGGSQCIIEIKEHFGIE